MPPYGATQGTTQTIWLNWASSNTTVTDTTVQVWNNWTSGTANTTVIADFPAVSAEELEARQQGQRQARERARALLLSVLTDEQKGEYEEQGHFHVTTREGERVYRLRPGSPPVRIQGEDGSRWSYCIHPDYGFPAEDVAVAHKLLLETDEEQFLQTANASAVR